MAAKKKIKKKEAKGSKPKLKEMSQTHGMDIEKADSSSKEPFEPSTLEQVWGDDGLFKYKTLDVNEYKKELGHMSKTDLRNHAVTVGLLPIDDAGMLEERLIREFTVHANSYRKPKSTDENPKSISVEAQKILGEGR
jgi:hypothetical protein